jgi:hypothetical protein
MAVPEHPSLLDRRPLPNAGFDGGALRRSYTCWLDEVNQAGTEPWAAIEESAAFMQKDTAHLLALVVSTKSSTVLTASFFCAAGIQALTFHPHFGFPGTPASLI